MNHMYFKDERRLRILVLEMSMIIRTITRRRPEMKKVIAQEEKPKNMAVMSNIKQRILSLASRR
jgi:hypothetical protein